MRLGERIKNYRKKSRQTRGGLANKLGISKEKIVAWEKNEMSPDTYELNDLARALGISVDTLLGHTEFGNKTDFINNAYDDRKEKHKFKRWIITVVILTLLLIGGDTGLGYYLKRKPFISWKVEFLSKESYAYKGLILDTYYCNGNVVQKFKFSGYECPRTTAKPNNHLSNRNIETIIDKTTTEDITCAEALEEFYKDSEYKYYYNYMKSKYVIVKYKDGMEETVKDALIKGKITLKDLDIFNIDYIKEPRNSYNYKEIELSDTVEDEDSSDISIKIIDGKVYAVNNMAEEKMLIFDKAMVTGIGKRIKGNDIYLLVLTENNNAYISKSAIVFNSTIINKGIELEFIDVPNIKSFKIYTPDESNPNKTELVVVDNKSRSTIVEGK